MPVETLDETRAVYGRAWLWVRWLGRILIEFFLVFEILAFVHAA